jgi:hypothetical protein
MLRVVNATTPPDACAWSSSVHLSSVLLCSFEGLAVGGGRELAAQCHGMMSGMAVQ